MCEVDSEHDADVPTRSRKTCIVTNLSKYANWARTCLKTPSYKPACSGSPIAGLQHFPKMLDSPAMVQHRSGYLAIRGWLPRDQA